MKSFEMQIHKPYIVTKESTDQTLAKGNIIWLSKDGTLNMPDKYGGGFLLLDEWHSPETSDFEVEETNEYELLVIPGHEILSRFPANRNK